MLNFNLQTIARHSLCFCLRLQRRAVERPEQHTSPRQLPAPAVTQPAHCTTFHKSTGHAQLRTAALHPTSSNVGRMTQLFLRRMKPAEERTPESRECEWKAGLAEICHEARRNASLPGGPLGARLASTRRATSGIPKGPRGRSFQPSVLTYILSAEASDLSFKCACSSLTLPLGPMGYRKVT